MLYIIYFFHFFWQEHAFESSQKYKEGKFIIELAHMIKANLSYVTLQGKSNKTGDRLWTLVRNDCTIIANSWSVKDIE
jgi:hypothetical protein